MELKHHPSANTQPVSTFIKQGITIVEIPNNSNSPSSSMANLQSLRLPANYGATLGVKKILTVVPVRKPRKPEFFRTHSSPDMTFSGMVYENKEKSEHYLLAPDVASHIGELVRAVELHAAIDTGDNVFLIPLPLPDVTGNRNPWHESLAGNISHSQSKWIRISANKDVQGYDTFEATGNLPEPAWPEHDIEALVDIAFRGKIITDLDHPVIQKLLGSV